MDQQPKIPTLKDAQKPQVKIKGMGAGLTLFDRLKQFKKKDLAFILAGLGTLFMAPLAEHFMMAPENGDATLQKGWGGGSGSGSGIFGSGSSPYENGNNNIASGGAIGGAGDIITPLNVRDPSALVMGPGAAQQPNAGSAAPSAPPPTAPARSETDYKDALAGAASRAASAAVKKAPLPVPKIAVGGSGLRGLGVAGGGTSASGSLGPIGPAAGSTGAGGSSGLSLVRNAPGFRSAAGARSPTGGTGLDGTKKAGQNAGDAFSRTGSALSGLNAAANEQIPTGGQGYGGNGAGGAGANDKPYSGSGPGGSKSVGESLAFLEAKQRMEENLKLEFEKRKLKDPELLLYGIRNDSLKAIAQEMTKSLTGAITGFMDPSKSAAMLNCGGIKVPKSTANSQKCSGADGKGGAATDTACYKVGGDGSYTFIPATGNPIVCTGGSAADAAGASNTQQVASDGPNRLGPTGAAAVGGLNGVCTQIDELMKDPTSKSLDDGYLNNVGNAATQLAVFRDSMFGKTSDCATRRTAQAGTLDGLGKPLSTLQTAAFDSADKLMTDMIKDVQAEKVGDYAAKLQTANDSPTKLAAEASTALKAVDAYATEKKLGSPLSVGTPTSGLLGFGANKAKLEALKKTLDDSQTSLAAYLEKAKAAQLKLDGQPLTGGAAAPDANNPPLLTELGQIAVEPGTLLKVQDANVDYAKKKADIEKATEGATINRTAIEPKVEPVGTAAGTAKTKIGEVPAKAPEPKITENGVEKDNPAYSGAGGYQEKAKEARTAVESVRGAQATWLVNVQNAATTVKTSLTGAPTN